MKGYFLTFCLVLLSFRSSAEAHLLINEFVTNTSSDWVELTLTGEVHESMDISGLFVTMYYGKSEALADGPVTIRSRDLAETPYDDRYVVVHLTEPGGIDETDDVGDLNGNGIRDIYCNNYSSSLWNSDGIVAIDDDTSPSNGMIDCAGYSNRDGSMNAAMEKSLKAAAAAGQWTITTEDVQQSCIDIGIDGLASYMSVSRAGGDTDTLSDFCVTRFQTPGADNIIKSPVSEKDTFSVTESKIFCRKGPETEKVSVRLFVSQSCNIRLRVFTVTGRLLYESELYRDVMPGYFYLSWSGPSFRKNLPGGLYIGHIEATGNDIRGTVNRRVFFVLGRQG